MKILLTLNKTYRGHIEGAYWDTYLPLIEMGHDVRFYDTVSPKEAYEKVIESFRPDLIFCCITGDQQISPYESAAIEQIFKETSSGRTRTYNSFQDDVWRFDNFSMKACKVFNVCSTTEPSYIDKYKNIGYDNIILCGCYSNLSSYPKVNYEKKDVDLSFVGFITESRKNFFDFIDSKEVPVTKLYGVTHEEMKAFHTRSKIGINLSKNDNHPQRKTQIKQRLFEVPAAKGLLLTEYHDGIEEYYEIDKEIVTFKTYNEFVEKAKILNKNPKLVKSIALNGFERFKTHHESKIRLKKLLEDIFKC